MELAGLGSRSFSSWQGALLEDFELEGPAGGGVSGQVFRARHTQSGARAAVKVFHIDAADPDFRPRERFRRECRLLSRATGLGFPALWGCGETDGLGVAILEWIEGEPLTALRDAPVHEVVKLSYDIACALDVLHRAGAIHRDLAFDNVLVETRRCGRFARLIDLGVAKDLLDEDVTLPGSFLGRLSFAAPEAFGDRGALDVRDPRADLFSFGTLLYEWLSGEAAFAGTNPGEVLRAHRKDPMPRFRVDASRGALDPSFPLLVGRLIHVDLNQRPSARELTATLLEQRKLHPPPARPGPARREAAGFPSRQRLRSLRSLRFGASIHPAEPPEETRPPVARPQSPATLRGVVQDLGAHPKAGNWVLVAGVVIFVLSLAGVTAMVLR